MFAPCSVVLPPSITSRRSNQAQIATPLPNSKLAKPRSTSTPCSSALPPARKTGDLGAGLPSGSSTRARCSGTASSSSARACASAPSRSCPADSDAPAHPDESSPFAENCSACVHSRSAATEPQGGRGVPSPGPSPPVPTNAGLLAARGYPRRVCKFGQGLLQGNRGRPAQWPQPGRCAREVGREEGARGSGRGRAVRCLDRVAAGWDRRRHLIKRSVTADGR
jgi:hypothetical protein